MTRMKWIHYDISLFEELRRFSMIGRRYPIIFWMVLSALWSWFFCTTVQQEWNFCSWNSMETSCCMRTLVAALHFPLESVREVLKPSVDWRFKNLSLFFKVEFHNFYFEDFFFLLWAVTEVCLLHAALQKLGHK